MLEKQERTALLILLGVLCACGLSTLILENMGKEPFAQNYSISTPDGTLVHHQGAVQKVIRPGSAGSYILEMGNVQIFIPSSAAEGVQVSEGDQISLYGKVQNWKGKREILVENPRDITVFAASQEKNLRYEQNE